MRDIFYQNGPILGRMGNLWMPNLPERRWCRRVFPLLSWFFRTSQPISEQNFLTHILGWSWSVVVCVVVSTKCETSRSAHDKVEEVGIVDEGCDDESLLLELFCWSKTCWWEWWWLWWSQPNQCSNSADTSTLTQHSSENVNILISTILKRPKSVSEEAYFFWFNPERSSDISNWINMKTGSNLSHFHQNDFCVWRCWIEKEASL